MCQHRKFEPVHTKMMNIRKRMLVAVAIDVGTSSSGYAYVFRGDYIDDLPRIRAKHFNMEAGLIDKEVSLKSPTCMLLNPEREFLAFGYRAEDMYSDLVLKGNHSDYYFFKEFKTMLRETQELSRTILMKDVKGKEAPALDLFAHVIRYIKDDFITLLNMRRATVENEDIHWVLPVPAIWKKSAKNFMREAANKAGIPTEQLTICLEPEAVITYCQLLPAHLLMGNTGTQTFLSFSSGTKCIIIDLGCKTSDIYIYQKESDGTLKEFYISTGIQLGGDKVNEAFDQMIIKIIGASCFQQFKDDNRADYVETHKELDIKKKIDSKSNSSVRLLLPVFLFHTLKNETVATKNKMIQQTEYANKITVRGNLLEMDADLFKELFREPVDKLVEHLRQLMAKDNLSGISTILMIGEFSESPILLDAIMKAFPDKRVIVPYEAGLAVIKGAVWFGFKSDAVPESNPPGLL